MDHLLIQSRRLLANTDLHYFRFLHNEIRWDWRLIGIKGARGVGKTTLLLQHLHQLPDGMKGIYLSLDDLHFTQTTLRETVEQLRATGISCFFLDEVHKYPHWSREIKNLYDNYPDIFIVFTGSSIIELNLQEVDLSRRAVMYELPGLSFREYLILNGVITLPVLRLEDIFQQHESIATDLTLQFKPLAHFQSYLQEGVYPFFLEHKDLYHYRLKQVVRLVLETDLSTAERSRVMQVQKIGQLLKIIADSVPFKPNISQLAGKLGLDRNTLVRYLHHLQNARLIQLLYAEGANLSALQKPEKIYLNNSNLAYALCAGTPEPGSIREVFFYHQLSQQHSVMYSGVADFTIDNKWTIEIGGKTKGFEQIKSVTNSYLALDQIETGVGRKIPLWLFGMMY